MMTEFVITNAAERVELGSGGSQGEVSFTVTNQGSAPERVVFEVVPGDGADASWFVPPEEPQVVVPVNGSVSFIVRIAVPAGAAAGVYSLQGRVYPAAEAPEEGARLSGRVAFEVKPSAKPKKPWWPYAVAAGMVLVVLGVVGWLVLRPKEEPKPPEQDCIAGFVWREAVPGDRVCVTPQRHQQAQEDNKLADSRRSPTGGPFGPNTCRQGFVWREATPEDLVCVTPQTRTETRQDNALAASRRKPS